MKTALSFFKRSLNPLVNQQSHRHFNTFKVFWKRQTNFTQNNVDFYRFGLHSFSSQAVQGEIISEPTPPKMNETSEDIASVEFVTKNSIETTDVDLILSDVDKIWKDGRIDEAIFQITNAISAVPVSEKLRVMIQLIDMLMEQPNYDKADEILKQAETQFPKNEKITLRRADYFQAKDMLSEAEKMYLDVVKENPESQVGNLRLGQFYLEKALRKDTKGREEPLEMAQDYFTKAISLPGEIRNICDAYYGSAQCYKIDRKWEEVERQCEDALKVDEGFNPIVELLGEAQLALKKYYEANETLSKYISNLREFYVKSSPFGEKIAMSPEMVLPALVKRAMTSYYIGSFDSVHSDCKIVLEADYRFKLMAYVYKAKAFTAEGKYNYAAECANKAIKIHPHCVEAYEERAYAFHKMNRLTDAEGDFIKLHQLLVEVYADKRTLKQVKSDVINKKIPKPFVERIERGFTPEGEPALIIKEEQILLGAKNTE